MAKTTTVKVTAEFSVPAGTKIIRNDSYVTLAKPARGYVDVFTCPSEEVNSYDLHEERTWTRFSKEELKKLAAL